MNAYLTGEQSRRLLKTMTHHETVELCAQQSANLRALCVPKRLRIPNGYANPEELILTAFTSAHGAITRTIDSDAANAACFFTTSLLIRYQVPTYFVSAELCQALLHTEAPEDMVMNELPIPMPAMLVMLPLDFSRQYFGEEVPWITIAFVDDSYEPKSPVIINGVSVPQDWKMDAKGAKTVFVATLLAWEDGYPMHYASHSPMQNADGSSIQLKELMDSPVKHYQYFTAVTKEQDKHDNRIMRKLTTLAINIILGMTAEPELITRECMLEPPKKKDGKVLRKALWEPNYIGRGFRVQYEERPDELKGTHASPVPHPRIGHWRNQRHGPKNTLVNRIWIKPVFVGLRRGIPT